MSVQIQAPSSVSRPVVALQPGEGEVIWFLDHLVTIKLRGKDAPYGVLEVELAAGHQTPFHRHEGEDEAFYVLEGEISVFFEGGRVVRGRAGSYFHTPRGVAHGFRADTNLRLLALSDAAGFVEFTREYGVPAPRAEFPPDVPPDFARLETLSRKYQIAILGALPEG